MRNICTAISKLVCLSFVFELITLTLARMHSLEALAVKGSSNTFVPPSVMKSPEASTSSLGGERRHRDTSQQTIHDIISTSDRYHKHIYSSGQRASVLEIIASALNYPSEHSRTVHDSPLKHHKLDLPRLTTRSAAIDNASIRESSFPKHQVELFLSFPRRFFTSKQIHNRESQHQQTGRSESSAHRRHRHLVKRQSSLITEYCGHLGRERCMSLEIGHCAEMCINGRRHRTVCRLRHRHRDAFCIVRSSNRSPT